MKNNIDGSNTDSSFLKKLFKKRKGKEIVEISVDKDFLTNPYDIKDKFANGFFNKFNKNKIVFICSDSELFFNEQEAMVLIENYNIIKNNGCELNFIETISGASYHDIDNYTVSDSFQIEKEVKRSFEEVMQINAKLIKIAEKINKGFPDETGKIQKLSPAEKYFLCFEIVNDIEFFMYGFGYIIRSDELIPKNFPSQSYIDTVKKNRGCCVGKSKYLEALLHLVGITNCSININSKMECYVNRKFVLKADPQQQFVINGKSVNASEIEEFLQDCNYSDNWLSDHQANLIYLVDDKYKIDGAFIGDSTSYGAQFVPIKEEEDRKLLFNPINLMLSGKNINNFFNKLNFKKKCSPSEEFIIEKDFAKECGDELFKCAGHKLFDIYKMNQNPVSIKNPDDVREYCTKTFGENRVDSIMEDLEVNHKFANLLEAIQAKINLENAPVENVLTYETYCELTKKAHEIYTKNFKIMRAKNMLNKMKKPIDKLIN